MGAVVRLPTAAPAVFAAGLAQIRAENEVPQTFPDVVLSAAQTAAARSFGTEHVDRTDLPFVTLDPATSTDLDQAFTIEKTNGDALLLRYAIADVAWFVRGGDPLDTEAWSRGVTTYMPDSRAGLYPPVLSEGAASLLPEGPRAAVVFVVRVASDGTVKLDGAERAIIRSRAKLAYETAGAADLPQSFADFAARIQAAEDRRGASRVETPEQEIVADGKQGYRIVFRPRVANEDNNAAMSLAANMAVADALYAAGTGLFRVMAEPDERRERSLRFSAKALGLDWPDNVDLHAFERTVHKSLLADGTNTDSPSYATHAAFLVAVRRATGGARYAPFESGVKPWHSAMASTYCHSTAPLRRLGDRFNVVAALAVANGQPVPDDVQQAFAKLPEVMERADTRASRVERAVIEMVEAVMLRGREGQMFDAVVTDDDDRGAHIHLCDPAVLARVPAHGVSPGDRIRVRLVASDPVKREVKFERVS
jgi:exoribonuclease R